MKGLLQKLKISKIEFFLILGFFISAYSFSITISSCYRYYRIAVESNKFYDDYLLTTLISKHSALNLSDYIKSFTDNDINDFSLNPIASHGEQKNVMTFNKVFLAGDGFDITKYADISGRYLNKDELKSNKKLAVIGEASNQYSIRHDDKSYVQLFNDLYEITGVIRNSNFFIDTSIIPIMSLGFEASTYESLSFLVNKTHFNSLKNLENSSLHISFKEIPQKSIVKYIVDNVPNFKEISYEIYLGLINLVLFSFFFANSIKSKIAIMKVLGAKNTDIFKELLSSILKLSTTGIVLGLLSSYITIHFMSTAFPRTYSPLGITNISITFLIVYLISILVSIGILFNVMKFKLMKDIR